MANKKLVVTAPDAISDATKDAILAAANVAHGAAKVVRDANGKVMEVIIHLPPTASEAAAAAIAATPGVSNVEVTDIPEGTQGWDATAAGIASLEAAGFSKSVYNAEPLYTYNEDSTCTMNLVSWYSNVRWTGYGKLPSAPVPLTIEMKIKCPNGSQNNGVVFANDGYAGSLQLQGNDPNYPNTNTLTLGENDITEQYAYTPVDDQFHVYKMTVSETGLAKVYFDDVEKISWQMQYRPWYGNFVQPYFAIYENKIAVLDYIRWSKRP